MKKNPLFKIALIAAVASLLSSCGASTTMVDPTVRLAYEKEQNDVNSENLAKQYSSTINKNRKTGVKEPGLYCDYAVALVAQGMHAEANSWFNREMEEFPVSKQLVMQLKKELIPEYLNENVNVNENKNENKNENDNENQNPNVNDNENNNVDGEDMDRGVSE